MIPSFVFSNMCSHCENKRKYTNLYRRYSVTTITTTH